MQPLIIANWKSNKKTQDAKEWLDKLENRQSEFIIAAPFTLLSFLSDYLTKNNLNAKLASQNVSPFEEGAFTGEVSASQVKEFADYVLIGHSERRRLFNETEDMLADKVAQSKKAGLKVIYFIQDESGKIPQGVDFAAYEPPESISTSLNGEPEDPSKVNDAAKKIKTQNDQIEILYGGSVDAENVNSYTSLENVSGVVVGGASLDPEDFSGVLKNA